MATPDDNTAERTPLSDDSPFVTRDAITLGFCTPFPSIAPNAPVMFDPQWRTETVVGLARGIDADAAYDRLPILADALEEAGCDHPSLLHHCRTCPHPFACCWVVNVILDRLPGVLPPVVNHPAPSSHIPIPAPSPRPVSGARSWSDWGAVFRAMLFVYVVMNVIQLLLNLFSGQTPTPPIPTANTFTAPTATP